MFTSILQAQVSRYLTDELLRAWPRCGVAAVVSGPFSTVQDQCIDIILVFCKPRRAMPSRGSSWIQRREYRANCKVVCWASGAEFSSSVPEQPGIASWAHADRCQVLLHQHCPHGRHGELQELRLRAVMVCQGPTTKGPTRLARTTALALLIPAC